MSFKQEERTTPNLYGNPLSPGAVRKAESTVRKYSRKYRFNPDAKYPLYARDNAVIGPPLGVKEVYSGQAGEPLDGGKGIIIGTIRMGYGHYRMSMAIASAAHSMGLTPYWFDLLGFDSPGAKLIHNLDYWYSFFSKVSQKSSLFNRFVWDPLLGKAYRRVEKNYSIMQVCRLFADVYKGLPPDMPVVGSHPWPALAARFAGMSNVINIVPDNCPLGFHLAPGALHTVQGPSAYMIFRMLRDMGPKGQAVKGVPASDIRLTGHYIDHELAANIEEDCAARLTRIGRKDPRRLLISVGGAGAQQGLLIRLVEELLPMASDGRVVLFLNFGDHQNIWEAFRKQIRGFDEIVQQHSDWNGTAHFAEQARAGEVKGVHGFLHDNTFAAVYATNVLMRASDVLLTKPSELAYYPVPKLFLQRVGGHEAWGAIRGSELGDGTVECTNEEQAIQMLNLLVKEDDILSLLCENIVRLNKTGVYHGAYRVVEMALERR